MGIQGERWVVKHKLDGLPTPQDFELVKEDLGDLKDGEIAFESEFISVDPYQARLFITIYSTFVKLPLLTKGHT